MTKMLAMYSGCGGRKISAIECRQSTRLRGDALNCQSLLKPQTRSRLVAGMLTRSCVREYQLAARFQSAIRQLVTALYLSNKQGIGIIFIVDYFATCFALRVVQYFIVINLTSEINAKKESAFTTSVKRAITHRLPNKIPLLNVGLDATI